MKFNTVFWDIDGTLYDNTQEIPDNEKEILSSWKKLEEIPERELTFWVPYQGLSKIMATIPQENQGVISNGIHQLQIDKLCLLGLKRHINPALIFTSYGEAEKILTLNDHPFLKDQNIYASPNFDTNVYNMTLKTQKPEPFMFKKAINITKSLPEECVMIGNNWKDIQGAQSVGMKTIYISGAEEKEDLFYNPIAEGDIIPDYSIRKGDMDSLARLLI